jgi:hypothetical protein
MGKGGDTEAARATAKTQGDIGNKLVDFAQGQWNEAAPYRQQTSQYWSNILKGGQALQASVAPQINSVSRQFATAKNAVSQMPLGGSRDVSMRNLRLGEAGTKSSIYSGGINDALARLANQANLGTQTGLSGMSGGANAWGGAGSQYTSLAQLGQQNAAGLGAGIGSLVGMI